MYDISLSLKIHHQSQRINMESKTIKSPEGVKLLMENIWLRHQAGMKQRQDNVYVVDLSPASEEECPQLPE